METRKGEYCRVQLIQRLTESIGLVSGTRRAMTAMTRDTAKDTARKGNASANKKAPASISFSYSGYGQEQYGKGYNSYGGSGYGQPQYGDQQQYGKQIPYGGGYGQSYGGSYAPYGSSG
jgi:hypothetical protein